LPQFRRNYSIMLGIINFTLWISANSTLIYV
jgi:hypothetical protein